MVAYFCDPEYANAGLEKARRDARSAARLASDLRDSGRASAAQQDVHIYGQDTVGWFGHARLRRYWWAAVAFLGCRSRQQSITCMHRAHLVCDRSPPPSGNMEYPSLESCTNARKLGQDASESSSLSSSIHHILVVKPVYMYVTKLEVQLHVRPRPGARW